MRHRDQYSGVHSAQGPLLRVDQGQETHTRGPGQVCSPSRRRLGEAVAMDNSRSERSSLNQPVSGRQRAKAQKGIAAGSWLRKPSLRGRQARARVLPERGVR